MIEKGDEKEFKESVQRVKEVVEMEPVFREEEGF